MAMQRQGRPRKKTVDAQHVINFSSIQSLENKICVINGTNLRKLRDGLGICSPGIIVPGQRIRKHFGKVVRRSLLDICDRNILASAVTRRNHLLLVLTENFLDKGVRKLAKSLSELPGKTVEAAIKKPQFPRLKMINCISELENGPGKKCPGA